MNGLDQAASSSLLVCDINIMSLAKVIRVTDSECH